MRTPSNLVLLSGSVFLLIVMLASTDYLSAQTYNMSAGTINTCSGTFYDSGGSGGNYANNSNIVQTFCSNGGAGTCFQIQFNSFNTRDANDYLRIYDGPSTASPIIGTYYGNLGAFALPLVSSTGCLTFQFISNNTQNRAGWAATISCVPCPPTPGGGGIHTHPTVGLQNTYVGDCMQNECNGTYYDDGGSASNYQNNISLVYWTFCPNTAGNCVRATFHSFDVEAPFIVFYDYLTIGNGPTQNSPEFGAGSTWAGACGSYQSCMGAGLGPYVSTDASGCITMRFTSDFSVTRPGWEATIDCVPCAYGPSGTSNADCSGLIPICSNTPFSSVSDGPGISSEGCAGCNLSENYSNWFAFQAQTTGVLQMTIDPVNNNDDYDFAIYGPNVTCNGLGSPIRCSYASNINNTGTNGTAGDTSEDVYGDGWVSNLNVVAGQSYMLMINKWTPGGSGYTIDWSGSTASLDCSILPVDLLYFNGEQEGSKVKLQWATASEINSSKFVIERAAQDLKFEQLIEVRSAGNSNDISTYIEYDLDPLSNISYYKLIEEDIDGERKDLGIINVDFDQKSIFEIKTVYFDQTGSILLNFYNNKAELCDIQLISTLGKVLVEKEIRTVSGLNEIVIDNLKLSSGIYFMAIANSNQKLSKKILLNTH